MNKCQQRSCRCGLLGICHGGLHNGLGDLIAGGTCGESIHEEQLGILTNSHCQCRILAVVSCVFLSLNLFSGVALDLKSQPGELLLGDHSSVLIKRHLHSGGNVYSPYNVSRIDVQLLPCSEIHENLLYNITHYSPL